MPTVWAVHEVNDDVSAALGFGPIRFINHRYVYGDEMEQDGDGSWTVPANVTRALWAAAQEFKPLDDYLLIAGDHLQLLAMTARLAALYGPFFVLRFDRKLKEYIPVRLHSGLPSVAQYVSLAADIGPSTIGTEHGQDRHYPQGRHVSEHPNEEG